MHSPERSLALVDLARTPAWEEVVAGLSAGAARVRLGEADFLADGSDDDRATALAVYRVLQDALDPRDGRDCDRIDWVLNTLRAYDGRFLPLFRRAAEHARRDVVRLRAGVAVGAFLVHENEAEEGERHFLRVLAESRGKGTIPERGACLNLCRLYAEQSRVFEGYAMARHALRLFRAANDSIREGWALTEVHRCLTEMQEWEACDALVSEIEALFAGATPDVVEASAVGFHENRLRSALARKDAVNAWALLNALPDLPASSGIERRSTWYVRAVSGVVQSLFGRHEQAAEIFARLHDQIPRDSTSWLVMLQQEATCAAAREDGETLCRNADEILGVPHATLVKRLGSGRAMHILLEVVAALRSLRHELFARRALEAAAACAVERIREIERAQRDLPELGLLAAEDRTVLSRMRTRFGREHRELLDALARAFEAADATGEPWLASIKSGDHFAVCAWCARLRGEDGAWMPFGHLVPLAGPFPVTHGMCDDCYDELQRAG